ncbi:hypothetical protein [Oceanobacillus manasiensis]|uniref:hypothetical protein n=1 Tax=Oceanobacillus manasiensis TaxID=586413 RepID=UPI0005A79DA2|nr:hypothetical protein [Oceanobacillus manasiensis]
MSKEQLYQKIYGVKEQLAALQRDFWNNYSDFETWYFWFNLLSIFLPLLLLYVLLDRKRLFEISFFGYSAHVLWANIDNILSSNNYLLHPHSLTYLLPVGFSVTTVIFPVAFMLVYQYCTQRNKNPLLYFVGASLLFAFGFGGISHLVGLIEMHKGMNLFYLFLIDIVVSFLAYGFTKLFIKIKHDKRSEKQ